MSIDIDWATLSSGPDGDALGESIRAFIHERFQKLTLPKFIKRVDVHHFDFGSVAPNLTIKDICDPLPDFYGADDGEEEDERLAEERVPEDAAETAINESQKLNARNLAENNAYISSSAAAAAAMPPPPNRYAGSNLNHEAMEPPVKSISRPGLRSIGLAHHQPPVARPLDTTSIMSNPPTRTSTPGIPGGTSNLSYFHLPLGAGLSGNGASTPLAAVSPGFGNFSQSNPGILVPRVPFMPAGAPAHQINDRPAATSTSSSTSSDGSAAIEPRPEDIQVVAHLRYDGDVRLGLTAEILLDFPSSAFVGIPLALNVTGMSFDGIVLVAYLRGKICFSFLDPDDGAALVGADQSTDADKNDDPHEKSQEEVQSSPSKAGGLFEEIKIESEIGQRQEGRQALKNVGKVEKFVLEQVRRIFEQEVVYPSFWTFLV